jgi:flagellar biosynthesis protein FlhF
MKIKKFTANDIKEGKRQVVEELGPDAVILSNRIYKDPQTGEDAVEIVAAIDETIPKSKGTNLREKIEQPINSIKNLNKSIGTHSNELILGELDLIKNMLFEISDSIKFRNTASMGTIFSKLYKKLRTLEISEEQSLRIINRIISYGNITDIQEAVYEARKILIEGIEIGKPLQKNVKSQIIMFIGTTGSGKTASLVKLAIISKIISGASSIIISADTYKVGAAEQLETFSNIASIPFKSSFTNDDLKQIIKENHNNDYIFIDTTGFSQKDEEQLIQLSEMVKIVNPDLIYLTLPAVISELTANSVLNAVKSIPIDSIIITKTDEAETIGGLINVIKSNKIPVSYITNGIKIPEDIQPADRIILGKLSIKD